MMEKESKFSAANHPQIDVQTKKNQSASWITFKGLCDCKSEELGGFVR